MSNIEDAEQKEILATISLLIKNNKMDLKPETHTESLDSDSKRNHSSLKCEDNVLSSISNISYKNLSEFLKAHLVKDKIETPPTNTRIGDKDTNIYGGSYFIRDSEYKHFLDLYSKDVFVNNKKEYITERQLDTGALLVDIDFRFSYEIDKRLYTCEQIDNLIVEYLEILKTIYQFDNEDTIEIFVLEKTNVNRIEGKKITKDGVHIIFGLLSDRETQQYIRRKILSVVKKIFHGLPLINEPEDIIDETIATGKTNWQLYGSGKPNNEVYKITRAYNAVFDDADCEFSMNGLDISNSSDKKSPNSFNIIQNINKLSARCKTHPQFMFNAEFLQKRGSSFDKEKIEIKSTTTLLIEGGGKYRDDDMIKQLLSLKTKEELNELLIQVLEKWEASIVEHYLYDAYLYVMCLPEIFYGEGSYEKWIKVGCALRNTNNKLFIIWVIFSSQSKIFNYKNDISLMYEKWGTFDKRNVNGLTIRSIIHWAKTDAQDKWAEVYKKSIDFYIEETLGTNLINNKKVKCSCGDYDLANVLYNLYKDKFCCGNIQAGIWYVFKDNRWVINDSGTALRNKISTELKKIYQDKLLSYMEQMTNEPNEDKKATYKFKMDMICEICSKLGKTNDKKNIMTEAKEIFYDEKFLEKLDTNPYLLCFTNGIFDFKSMIFRKGVPEDYVSKSTHNIYKPLDEYKLTHVKTIEIIKIFMKQLFPVAELEKYMWEHLASSLIGTSSNQTFNMYIGVGQNGKSVLTSLMTEVLSEYCCDVPLSIVTEKRQKIGGLSPEIVAMKGVRYAVMQEPGKNERLQESCMKQLTSGLDPISCRAPYMVKNLSFIPQFKLVVCSNELMEIKSQDHGTWRRIRIVPFMSLFVEKPITGDKQKPYQYPIDKNIKEKFPEWKGIFISMLISVVMRTNGNVEDCATVLKASDEYRKSQDCIAEFVAERIIVDETQFIKKNGVGQEFSVWYLENYGRGQPNLKDVHTYMDKHFGKYEKHKCWKGVGFANSITNISQMIDIDDENNNEHDTPTSIMF